MQSFLPEGNIFPSGYSYNKNMNKNYDDQARVIQKTAEYSYCVMKFCF